jgi:hypothetical protein
MLMLLLLRDTITAEMAFMFMERNAGRTAIDYPVSIKNSVGFITV